jgi:hypothetical protein
MFILKGGFARYPVKVAIVVFRLASGALLPGAQAPTTEYQLNTPYVCTDGTSYTFIKLATTGYFSTCYYTI